MKLGLFAVTVVAALALAAPGTSSASAQIRYGVEDEAYLGGGQSHLRTLDTLGVKLVRYTVNWRRVATRKPARPLDPDDPAYDWSRTDRVLPELHRRRIDVIVTLYGAPAWANGGHAGNVLPLNKYSLAAFAGAVSARYPWVRLWEVWNEPNLQIWLQPNSPRLYVQRLLNPTYVLLHLRRPGSRVAGGSTSPRPTTAGLSPVAFMRGMRAAHARLDVYSHHPYPITPGERPSGFVHGACRYCKGILTLANLPVLVREVERNFGPKRIWLTEYGYQTNRRKRFGVSLGAQARYVADAALRARTTPYVDVLIHFLIEDESQESGWQSGLLDEYGARKPSFDAFMLPLAQVSRRGPVTTVWGQVRPGKGLRWYRLQRYFSGRWVAVGPWTTTNARGSFIRRLRVGRGTRLRIVAEDLHPPSPVLTIR